jgi:hypothetical protein
MASSGPKEGDAANSCEYGNPPLLHKRRYMSWSADRLFADQGELGRALLRKNATLMSLTCITLLVSSTNNATLQLTRFRHVLRTCTRMCPIVNRRKATTDVSSLYYSFENRIFLVQTEIPNTDDPPCFKIERFTSCIFKSCQERQTWCTTYS